MQVSRGPYILVLRGGDLKNKNKEKEDEIANVSLEFSISCEKKVVRPFPISSSSTFSIEKTPLQRSKVEKEGVRVLSHLGFRARAAYFLLRLILRGVFLWVAGHCPRFSLYKSSASSASSASTGAPREKIRSTNEISSLSLFFLLLFLSFPSLLKFRHFRNLNISETRSRRR